MYHRQFKDEGGVPPAGTARSEVSSEILSEAGPESESLTRLLTLNPK